MFNFASRPAQLYRALNFDLLGIPQDYLFRCALGGGGCTQSRSAVALSRGLLGIRQEYLLKSEGLLGNLPSRCCVL